MKKRLFALLLSGALCLGLASPAFAISNTPDGPQAPGTDPAPTTTESGGNNNHSHSGGGGGSYTPPAEPTYDVSASANAGGTVSMDKPNAKKGDTVTLTVTPSNGYQADGVTVKDAKGNVIATTSLGGGKYSFVMPDSAVTIAAKFAPVAPTNPFADVAKGEYYYDAVLWAVSKGITTGTSASAFAPNETCTRAQTVTFLWRAAGCPVPASAGNPFADVDAGGYYYQAVLWAVESGITNGTSATTFSPDETVTRGQTVTFLYRAAKAQAAAGSTPFLDVTAGEYYADAVQWAVGRGVTNGTSATTFGPAEGCTRGQIVTFLYRDRAN